MNDLSVSLLIEPVSARPLPEGECFSPSDPLPELVRALNTALESIEKYMNRSMGTYESVLLPGVPVGPLQPLKGDLHEHVLLHRCAAEPFRDEPRLDYAEWLESQGYVEVARYIRISCQRARLTSDETFGLPILAEATRKFWQMRFQDLRVPCLITVPENQASPSNVRAPLSREWSYSREIVRGLPSRVIIWGDRLRELFHTRREENVLWLAEELWVPCNRNSKTHLGMWGNCAALGKAVILGRLLKEHLAQSPLVRPETRLKVFP